jgi:two-component system, NtrC family, sensor kinase
MSHHIEPDSAQHFVPPPSHSGAPFPILPDSFPRLDIEQVRQILPQLIDAIADAVVVVDRQRRVVAANRRFADAFGFLEPDVVGALCHEALGCTEVDPSARAGTCAACEVIRLKESRRLLRTLPDASGAVRRWEATLSPVLDERGEPTHVVEVWRDITERSQLESQLSHSERLASLGMLAAGVAHEINNPLASIVAGIETLQRWLARTSNLDPESRADVGEVLDMLDRETRRSRETTEKLLMLAQPYQISANWTDVNRAVSDTMALLRYQMIKQDVTPVEALDEHLPAIWARGSGIRGALMNLCMNAVQAMPTGGTLAVRTRSMGEGRVSIEIEDTGPGIHSIHLDRIWDPFFTTKPVGQGTGLGLSITQGIVARHGGSIRVENAVPHGARFVIELPVEGPGGANV